MKQSRTSQFKVSTVIPELANRQIRQIDVALNEVQIINRNQALLACGIIRREIRYLEPDARQRRFNDEIQFEVVLEANRAEPVPFFQTELKQEYFILQPTTGLGSQAVLEQAFKLTIWWSQAETERAELTEILQLERVIERGNLSRIVKLPVALEEKNAVPKEGTAQLLLDAKQQFPLVTGTLKGQIGYRGQAYRECEFEQTVSFLMNELPVAADGSLNLNGIVSDISWLPDDMNKNIWIFVMKLDFEWFLTQTQELVCLTPGSGDRETVMQLKTSRLLCQQSYRFEPNFALSGLQGQPTEVQVAVKRNKEVFTKNGLLLTAEIIIEAFYEHPRGMEAYQQWKVEFNQLVPGPVRPEEHRQIAINALTGLNLKKYTVTRGQLQVELDLTYALSFVEERYVRVVTVAGSSCTILARVRLDQKTFTLMDEVGFRLRSQALQINRVQAEVSNLTVTPKPGWLNVRGQLEVTIIYYDNCNQQGMDVYCHNFQESFLWEGLLPSVEVNSKVKLEFDSYEKQGQHLLYKYLLAFQMESLQKKELQIAGRPVGSSTYPEQLHPSQNAPEVRQVAFFMLEAELPLQSGKVKEVAAHRTSIDGFHCREVGKALLVEGTVHSELEYWDMSGFLHQEGVVLPFWRFIQCDREGIGASSRLVPEIRQCNYEPVSTWPWRKSSIRIRAQIQLCLWGGESPTSEGIAPKPEGFFKCSSGRYGPVGQDQGRFGEISGKA
ncbi:MAG TPA: hypothetical protein VIM29_07020 [Bacillota bacterium]